MSWPDFIGFGVIAILFAFKLQAIHNQLDRMEKKLDHLMELDRLLDSLK